MDEISDFVLPQIADMNFVQDLTEDLYLLFRVCIFRFKFKTRFSRNSEIHVVIFFSILGGQRLW